MASELWRLSPGDHLCCLFDSEAEQRALIEHFIRLGLERSEKVLYVVDEPTSENILGILSDRGLDVGPRLASGQLVVLSADDAYMKMGTFDPDGMIALLAKETQAALNQGFSALRVAGEMSWALRGLPGSERLIEYESKLNRFFPGSQCLAVCQYDRRRFRPRLLQDVLRTHPIAVIGETVYENHYFVEPDDMLGDDLPGAELRAWISHLWYRKKTEMDLRTSEARWRALTEGSPDLIVMLDTDLRIQFANEAFPGMTIGSIIGKPLPDCMPEPNRTNIRTALEEALDSGTGTRFEADHVGPDGTIRFYEMLVAVLRSAQEDTIVGLTVSARDVTERTRQERVLDARLRLIEKAATISVMELLRSFLDEVEVLTGSKIGFFHFVDEETQSLTLQTWSTRTLAQFCKAANEGLHYPISEAGVWVDCVHARAPVIHNDYSSLLHRKGMPEGHAPVIRELAVPVIREGKIVAVLGTGNKETAYDQSDVRTVTSLADLAWDIVVRKLAEHSLQESERKYRILAENVADVVWTSDLRLNLTYISPSVEKQRGFTVDEALAQPIEQRVQPDSLETIRRALAEQTALEQQGLRARPVTLETESTHKNGSTVWVETTLSIFREGENDAAVVLGIDRDITERVRHRREREQLEEQYRHIQRVEAIGRLAGGMAHDLNNLLSPILGYGEFLLEELDPLDPNADSVRQIQQAASRARDLVQRLLAVSRKQTLEMQPVDLNTVVHGIERLLRRTIREDIDIDLRLMAELPAALADAGQIEQVIMNLVMNAQDAMPHGGRLTIKTAVTDLDRTDASSVLGLEPGTYVVLTVADTGSGISEETQKHLFEPFFTTKGKLGTGLGLATVYGIVAQHGGSIRVESQPDCGAVFEIYLPVSEKRPVEKQELSYGQPDLCGSEVILLVEDDRQIRELAEAILRRKGYSVVVASGGDEALNVVTGLSSPVDLLVTDVVMPGLNGKELFGRVAERFPDLKVLYMSGYAGDVVGLRGVLDHGINFIHKPFSVRGLAEKVRSVLEQS